MISRFTLIFLSLYLFLTKSFAGCQISSQNMDFGSYDPSVNYPARSIAKFTLICTDRNSVTIELGASSVTGSITERKMRHITRPEETIAYTLTSDFSGARVWGDSTENFSISTPVGYYTTISLFGQISPDQQPWVGEYHDTIVLTIQP